MLSSLSNPPLMTESRGTLRFRVAFVRRIDYAASAQQGSHFILDEEMNSTDALLEKLIALGATLRPPATGMEIAECERTLRCEFPDAVRDFYRRCDGVGDATADWIWDFFSLERAIERTVGGRSEPTLAIDDGAKLRYADLVCFCDVLIDAPTYLFCGNRAHERFCSFFADLGGDGWFVAKSYDDFVHVFIAENDSVLLNT